MDGMDWLIIVPINVMYTCMFMYSICYMYHGESMCFELCTELYELHQETMSVTV